MATDQVNPQAADPNATCPACGHALAYHYRDVQNFERCNAMERIPINFIDDKPQASEIRQCACLDVALP